MEFDHVARRTHAMSVAAIARSSDSESDDSVLPRLTREC